MNQKKFFKNVLKDTPEWIKTIIFIALTILIIYIIGKYAPFAASLKQAVIESFELECTSFIKSLFGDLMTGFILFFGSVIIIAATWLVVYLSYCAVTFFIIEYRISKLPDDYFTRYSEISPEKLCSLLDVFHFHGHCLSNRPSFLENNMKHILLLVKNYTAEQIEIIKQNAAAKGYFQFFSSMRRRMAGIGVYKKY